MDRASLADTIVHQAGFSKEYLKSGAFTLLTYQRFNKHSDKIVIYIEGDGKAWENRHQLSDDPTPSNPLALKLAALDFGRNIAYIARPGQFSQSGFPDCEATYWSNRRYSSEVVESMDRAVNVLKEKSGTKSVELIGYSGGGAIAVLIAARRNDLVSLRTVAGNLNTSLFCVYHHVSRLDGSLNPLDSAKKIARIPQRHFIGLKDTVIPSSIAVSFVKMAGDQNDERITMVDGVLHNDGWEKRWKSLLSTPLR